MNDDSRSDKAHVSPELRLIRARRAIRFFGLFSASLLLSFLFFAIWLGYYFRLYKLENEFIPDILLGYAAISFVLMLSVSIPLQLEFGSDLSNWKFIYRESRTILDADRAQRNERRARENRIIDEEADEKDVVHGLSDTDRMTLLSSIRSEADARETSRWAAENYPALTRAIIERLEKEIVTQGGRANINLGLALLVASVGIAILAWLSWNVSQMMQGQSSHIPNGMLYAGAFAAKLTLALSANIFAFFFLATYRRNLSEIRYFHNELTNVQTRVLALYIAADKNISSSLSLAIKGLSATERNFILKKGESTTDLSLKGLDASEVATLAALLKEMAQVSKKS